MYREGRTVFVEVKRGGGKARPLQEYRIKELKEIGVEALVCDSIEKFKELL
jgi:predicted peroxiredoxin